MQVELLYHTPDPERAIATAARLCYAPVGASELMETMPEERVRSVLSTIMGSGHFSTLEHASYTFAVDGVSRALTHQLVRHRIASFNQQSQRYVKFTDGLATIKPESVAADEGASAVFDEAVRAAIEAYERLLAAGILAEDARYLLPNAAETKIVITMNVRELLHFFSLRCCNRAQWEIATWRTACWIWRSPRRRSCSWTPARPACAAPAPRQDDLWPSVARTVSRG